MPRRIYALARLLLIQQAWQSLNGSLSPLCVRVCVSETESVHLGPKRDTLEPANMKAGKGGPALIKSPSSAQRNQQLQLQQRQTRRHQAKTRLRPEATSMSSQGLVVE